MTKSGFDFTAKRPPTKWLVNGLFAQGKLLFNTAQGGIGKSFFLNFLATCMVYEKPFLDMPTEYGDVLLIDEDTPTDTLEDRLAKFGNHFSGEPKHTLHCLSMKGLSLKDGSLIKAIQEHNNVICVMIDCLTNICHGLDMNKARDMSILGELKTQCLKPNKGIIITHHISEKKLVPPEVLMACDPHSLTMYSSVINQQADGYYILASPDTDGLLKTLYVRPVAKRFSIKTKPFICHLVEDETTMNFNSKEPCVVEDIKVYDDIAQDLIVLFLESPEPKIVKKVDEGLGGKHGINAIRESLKELEKDNILHCCKGKSNLFQYSLKCTREEAERYINKQ